MNKRIYELSSCRDIMDRFDELKFEEKYQLANYLIIVGNNEQAFEVLKKIYKDKLSKNKIRQIDFLQLIYHINNDDKYNRDNIKYKLTKTNKKDAQYYNLICEENLEKKLKIFEEIVKTKKIRRYFKNKRYRNNIITTYLMNYGWLENPIIIKYIDKYINKTIKKMNQKKKLSIYEINFIKLMSNIIFSNLSFIYMKNNEFFIDFFEYMDLIKKAIEMKKNYKDFNRKKNVEFNTIMYVAIRDLINLDDFSIEEKEEMITFLNDFYNENIEEIDESIKIRKRAYSGNFWEEIENILKTNNEQVNLVDLIMTMACSEYKDIKNIYDKLSEIIDKYSDNVSENIKGELYLGREILNLWINGSFDRNLIPQKYRVSDFTNFIIEFFNGTIKLGEFEFELNNVEKIDCFEILNWKLLDKKCSTIGNFNWLLMILDRIDNRLDEKAMQYFEELYISISQRKRMIFLKDFLNISNKLIKKFDYNYFFLFNTANILIQEYDDFKDAENLIVQIVNNWDKINIKNKDSYFISLLLVIVEQNMTKIDINQIKNIVENLQTDINKNFILLYLSIIYPNIKITEKEYKEILKFIIEVFKNQDNIEDNLYRIIASFAMKYEQNKKIIQFPKYDLIYYRDEKHYYKNTEDVLLKESYSLLPVEETDNINNSEEEHALMFLMCRIFFEKIEEKGLGKKFTVSVNAGAKELMEQLNKALGMDVKINERRKIRDGKVIDTPWMNTYNYNSILEDIVSSKWKLFYNSKNNRFLGENKIIHISTLILLEKIGRLDILEKNNCYISDCIYEETIKRSKKAIVELGRGLTEEAIFYDAELDDLAESLQKLKRNEKIYSVTKAKIIQRGGINEFDDEMIKYILEQINESGSFCVITEDPYWLNFEPFSNITEGIISLLIDSFKSDLITSNELLESIKKLNDMQYNMNIGKILYSYLLTKSDDNNIKEIISIINNYKLK